MTFNHALDLETDIKPVTDFRANAATILEHVRESGRPVVLTQRGRSSAVLLDVRAYQSLVDELDELRQLQAGLADAAAGRVTPHDEALTQLLRNP
jgi:prevent-host-death family protein